MIADRRVGGGVSKSDYGYCLLPLYDSANADLQYVWGWLVNGEGDSYTYPAPTAAEIANYKTITSTSTRSWLRSWESGQFVKPFYELRPKLPFTDQNRQGLDTNMNPDYAWNFNDFKFVPNVAIDPWIPDDVRQGSPYIYEIEAKAITGDTNPDKGKAFMGNTL